MHLVNVVLITVVRKTQMREELICSVHWHYMPVRPEIPHHLSLYVLFMDIRYSVCIGTQFGNSRNLDIESCLRT
jgi:hypothetical protein